MKYLVMLTFASVLSCSTGNFLLSPTGLDRLGIKQVEYVRPDFYIGELDFTKKVGRSIASVVQTQEKMSNRQIYFLSLYGQYKKMGALLGETKFQNSCPRFHNLLLEHKNIHVQNIDSYSMDIDFSAVSSDPHQLVNFPVLAVPYSSQQDLYTKLSSAGWKESKDITRKGMHNLFRQTKSEVAELCDRGVSDGYYVYENLVSYFSNQNKMTASKKSLKALLKVSVIANMIVLDNLKTSTSGIDSNIAYESLVLQRSKSNWLRGYMYSLTEKREARMSQLMR